MPLDDPVPAGVPQPVHLCVRLVVKHDALPVLEARVGPYFLRLFPAMGTCLVTCYGPWSWTCVCSLGHLGLPCFGLWCCWIGSDCSRLCSHRNPIIAQTRSMELCRSSAALPYMLTIASSCSADLGLTQPPAPTYASCLTHAVCSPMYLSAPGLASCSQFNLLVTGTDEPPSPGGCSINANLVTGTDHPQSV
jgi:hypothetical protein